MSEPFSAPSTQILQQLKKKCLKRGYILGKHNARSDPYIDVAPCLLHGDGLNVIGREMYSKLKQYERGLPSNNMISAIGCLGPYDLPLATTVAMCGMALHPRLLNVFYMEHLNVKDKLPVKVRGNENLLTGDRVTLMLSQLDHASNVLDAITVLRDHKYSVGAVFAIVLDDVIPVSVFTKFGVDVYSLFLKSEVLPLIVKPPTLLGPAGQNIPLPVLTNI